MGTVYTLSFLKGQFNKNKMSVLSVFILLLLWLVLCIIYVEDCTSVRGGGGVHSCSTLHMPYPVTIPYGSHVYHIVDKKIKK